MPTLEHVVTLPCNFCGGELKNFFHSNLKFVTADFMPHPELILNTKQLTVLVCEKCGNTQHFLTENLEKYLGTEIRHQSTPEDYKNTKKKSQ